MPASRNYQIAITHCQQSLDHQHATFAAVMHSLVFTSNIFRQAGLAVGADRLVLAESVFCDCVQNADAIDGLMPNDYRRLTLTNGRSTSWSALPSSEIVTRLDSVTLLKIGVSDRCNSNKIQRIQ